MLAKDLLLAAGGGLDINGVLGAPTEFHEFTLQRHISNQATVITYTAPDGSTRRMAVLDAKHRSLQKFGCYGKVVNAVSNGSYSGFSSGAYIVRDSSTITQPNVKKELPSNSYFRNSFLADKWKKSPWLDESAKAQCDVWMGYEGTTDSCSVTGVPAVAWCRARDIFGNACDLPNLYQGMCIFMCSDKLDEMDPTASANTACKLGYTAPNGRFNGKYVWSCAPCDKNSTCTQSWTCIAYGTYRYQENMAVPILELEP